MVDISIVLPVYNVEEYLERSIESLLNQTYQNWEMILVNDGSTDDSGEICDKYAKSDSRIKVIHQENAGSGMARQTGIEKSKGLYICFVDPDDYLDQNALFHNMKLIQKFRPEVIMNGFHLVTKPLSKKTKKKTILPTLNGYFNKELFRKNYKEFRKVGKNNVWNKLYEREFIISNNIKFSTAPFGQDGDFNREIYKVLNSIYIDQNAFYYYDASREESAVKKYHKDRLEYSLKRIKDEREMFKMWNMADDYESIILINLLDTLISETINLSRKNDSLLPREKVKRLQTITNMEEFREMFDKLSYIEVRNPLRRIALYLFKKKHYKLALILISTYLGINNI